MSARRAALALLVALAGPACRDERAAEDELAAAVEVLRAQQGDVAAAARRRLVGVGRAALPVIEHALHGAGLEGRLNLAGALGVVGDPEAVPLLLHLAGDDEDEQVRFEATFILRRLAREAGGELARLAREAVRRLEEREEEERAG